MKSLLATQGLDGIEKVACQECGAEMVIGSNGGFFFNRGEPDDNIEEYLVCPVCGEEEDE